MTKFVQFLDIFVTIMTIVFFLRGVQIKLLLSCADITVDILNGEHCRPTTITANQTTVVCIPLTTCIISFIHRLA